MVIGRTVCPGILDQRRVSIYRFCLENSQMTNCLKMRKQNLARRKSHDQSLIWLISNKFTFIILWFKTVLPGTRLVLRRKWSTVSASSLNKEPWADTYLCDGRREKELRKRERERVILVTKSNRAAAKLVAQLRMLHAVRYSIHFSLHSTSFPFFWSLFYFLSLSLPLHLQLNSSRVESYERDTHSSSKICAIHSKFLEADFG